LKVEASEFFVISRNEEEYMAFLRGFGGTGCETEGWMEAIFSREGREREADCAERRERTDLEPQLARINTI
jgi:hypothetical protein